MDEKHNDNDDNDNDNNTTIKRKQGRGTRMWDEDKEGRMREEDNFGCGVIALYQIIHNIVTHIP